MSEALPKEGVDFRYLALEYYKKLGLSETELSVLLMINHLLNQQNDWVTPDMLSVKMNLKTAEVDKVMAGLVQRHFLSYVEAKEGGHSRWKTSLEPFSQVLWQQFAADVTRSNQNRLSADRAEELSEIYARLEKRLGKTLSPFDKDLINSWLDDGYRPGQIADATEDALAEGKKTTKAIGKMLRTRRAGDDFRKEGYTAVSDSWDRDIEKTIEIANAEWVDHGKNRR